MSTARLPRERGPASQATGPRSGGQAQGAECPHAGSAGCCGTGLKPAAGPQEGIFLFLSASRGLRGVGHGLLLGTSVLSAVLSGSTWVTSPSL